MPERHITQIDLLVHPDFHLIGEEGIEPCHAQLRKRWDARVAALSKNEGALLFYFPAIPVTERIPWSSEEVSLDLRIEEVERRGRYEKLLGDRLFIFRNWEKPSRGTLVPQFKDRNFTYNAQATQLVSYGEYLYLCVDAWQIATASTLYIPSNNQATKSDLSVVHPMHPSSFLYDI